MMAEYQYLIDIHSVGIKSSFQNPRTLKKRSIDSVKSNFECKKTNVEKKNTFWHIYKMPSFAKFERNI